MLPWRSQFKQKKCYEHEPVELEAERGASVTNQLRGWCSGESTAGPVVFIGTQQVVLVLPPTNTYSPVDRCGGSLQYIINRTTLYTKYILYC